MGQVRNYQLLRLNQIIVQILDSDIVVMAVISNNHGQISVKLSGFVITDRQL